MDFYMVSIQAITWNETFNEVTSYSQTSNKKNSRIFFNRRLGWCGGSESVFEQARQHLEKRKKNMLKVQLLFQKPSDELHLKQKPTQNYQSNSLPHESNHVFQMYKPREVIDRSPDYSDPSKSYDRGSKSKLLGFNQIGEKTNIEPQISPHTRLISNKDSDRWKSEN